jgi:PadR family transcriptional regulator PadR
MPGFSFPWEKNRYCDKKPLTGKVSVSILQKFIPYTGENSMTATRLSNMETLILAALEIRELYGLSIVGKIEETTGHSLSLGGLYTTLHRMEQKGLLTSRWGESTEVRQGARRRYYQITGLGQQALTETRQMLVKGLNLHPGLASLRLSDEKTATS